MRLCDCPNSSSWRTSIRRSLALIARLLTLQPESFGPIPEETARVARAAFPKGNVYMQMRDVLGVIYDD